MKTKWSLLVIFTLLSGLIISSPVQAAPQSEETAIGVAMARQTISAGLYHTCAIQTDGTIACWGSNVDYSGNWLGQATPPEGTFTQLDAGDDHTCAIRTDGTLACWGEILHNGETGEPEPVPSGTFTQVSSGEGYACAIRTDGTLACWGWLPLEDNTYETIKPPTGTFTQISAGDRHACAIGTDGTVTCWGRNYTGQSNPPDGTFLQVSAGYDNTCGIRTDGTLACWGWNPFLDNAPNSSTLTSGTFIQVNASHSHTCVLRSDGTVSCWINYPDYTNMGLGTISGPFVQITAGGGHSCGLNADGSLYCWGQNQSGQVNGTPSGYIGDHLRYFSEGTLPGSFGQRQVNAGEFHSCSIKADGTLACWGSNDYGEATPPEGTFRQVSLGLYSTCGLKSDGTLACWGRNDYGQSTPPEGTFRQVSLGGFHACGLKSDGTITCWGKNQYGESLAPDGTFVQVSAGSTHTCGIKTDGTVVCWGWNEHGEVTSPDGTFTQVSAGGIHTCALKPDGTLACWGGVVNQVGTAPSGSFTQVSAGGVHTCALKADGTVACWGYNLSNRATPPAGQFVQISAERYHTCGTRADGMLECWGGYYSSAFVLGPFEIPAGIVGTAYSQAFAPLGAYGGITPYSFSLTAGSLPSGLELTADGTLSGTPTELGTSAFTVQVVDANSLVARRDYSLTVNSVPQVTADPADLTVDEGSEVIFNAAADGTPIPDVQWEMSNDSGLTWNPIEGTTSGILAFPVNLEQNGNQYRAVFSNVAGRATTSAAILSVNAVAPTVVLDGTINANEGETKSYTFTSSDPGSGPYSLVTQSCGANGNLANDSFDPATGAGSFDCTFPDGAATSTVSVQVQDRAEAANDASTIEVIIANLAPQVSAVTIAPEPSILGEEDVASADFSDAGINDGPFTCTVDYGDGSGSLAGTVGGTTCIGPAHTYAAVGSYTVVVAVTDKDGAMNTASTAHSVLYTFVGFSQPVDNPDVLNIAKAGQIIPLKFRLLDAAGNPVTNLDPASVKTTVASLACSAETTTDLINEYTSGATGLQNLGDGYYQWNWKTPTTYVNSCKTMKLDLGEGVGKEHIALFQFKK